MTDDPNITTEPTTTTPPTGPYANPPLTTYAPGLGAASADDRNQAMLMWVLSIFFQFLAPLIFFLVTKDKPFVYRHAAMSLALCLVTAIVAIILFVTLVGILLIPLVGIFHLIICIMGAMAASRGEAYDPPMFAGMAKSLFKV